jgi:protein-S-isoprenylcysteine O-methyltransferase Ste14
MNILLFLVGSAGLLYISRGSLLNTRSHGFYRFFVWEIILVQILRNVQYWFDDPLSPPHLVSWVLLFASATLVAEGARLLHVRGRPAKAMEREGLYTFEKTTVLVTSGLYHHIRHPLYSSLLFLAWGLFFKNPAWTDGVLAATASALLVVTARLDEKECLRFFGPVYAEYMKTTKMFIPALL